MKLTFVGAAGQYVQDYPRRDIEVDDSDEARRLIATSCYEASLKASKTKQTREVKHDE